jgi:hypothetical protein
MKKLTLKKLAEYWLHVGDYQKIIPNTPENMVMTYQQANDLGRDILNLFERIEKIESILNFQNKEIK